MPGRGVLPAPGRAHRPGRRGPRRADPLPVPRTGLCRGRAVRRQPGWQAAPDGTAAHVRNLRGGRRDRGLLRSGRPTRAVADRVPGAGRAMARAHHPHLAFPRASAGGQREQRRSRPPQRTPPVRRGARARAGQHRRPAARRPLRDAPTVPLHSRAVQRVLGPGRGLGFFRRRAIDSVAELGGPPVGAADVGRRDRRRAPAVRHPAPGRGRTRLAAPARRAAGHGAGAAVRRVGRGRGDQPGHPHLAAQAVSRPARAGPRGRLDRALPQMDPAVLLPAGPGIRRTAAGHAGTRRKQRASHAGTRRNSEPATQVPAANSEPARSRRRQRPRSRQRLSRPWCPVARHGTAGPNSRSEP